MDQSPVRHTPKLPFTFSPPIAPRGMHDYLSSTAHTAVAPRVHSTTKSGQLRDCVTDSKKRSRGDALRKNTYKPIDTPVFTKRDALHDLGPVMQKSRDILVCLGGKDARTELYHTTLRAYTLVSGARSLFVLTGNLQEQLSADCFRQLGVTRAFGELSDAIAADVKVGMHAAFDRGVAQGKWLANSAEVQEQNDSVRVAYYNLQTQYRELHEQYQQSVARVGHLEACAKTVFTPGVHDFTADAEAVELELDINELLDLSMCGGKTDWDLDVSALNEFLDWTDEPITPHRQPGSLVC